MESIVKYIAVKALVHIQTFENFQQSSKNITLIRYYPKVKL